MKNFPAASKFAGKPFQQRISDSTAFSSFLIRGPLKIARKNIRFGDRQHLPYWLKLSADACGCLALPLSSKSAAGFQSRSYETWSWDLDGIRISAWPSTSECACLRREYPRGGGSKKSDRSLTSYTSAVLKGRHISPNFSTSIGSNFRDSLVFSRKMITSLVFSRKMITCIGSYRCCAPTHQ